MGIDNVRHLAPHGSLSASQRQQLAPTGTLRIGVAVGKAVSAVWTTREEATGKLRGVTIDLGAEMARWLDLPFEYVSHESSGHIIEMADKDRWDVAFTPVDAERKKIVDFGTNYYLGDSTYMVHADSPIETVEDVDGENVRVVGVENTATIRSARRTLTKTSALGVTSLEEAIGLFRSREADAIALGIFSASLKPCRKAVSWMGISTRPERLLPCLTDGKRRWPSSRSSSKKQRPAE
jgi:polar amino acid transport system substrate-binding protein